MEGRSSSSSEETQQKCTIAIDVISEQSKKANPLLSQERIHEVAGVIVEQLATGAGAGINPDNKALYQKLIVNVFDDEGEARKAQADQFATKFNTDEEFYSVVRNYVYCRVIDGVVGNSKACWYPNAMLSRDVSLAGRPDHLQWGSQHLLFIEFDMSREDLIKAIKSGDSIDILDKVVRVHEIGKIKGIQEDSKKLMRGHEIDVAKMKQFVKKRRGMPVDEEVEANDTKEASEADLKANLKQALQQYVARIEANKKGETINFAHGFKLFKKSQAKNREANYKLAKKLISEIDDPTHPIKSIFDAQNIKGLRKQYKSDGDIHSTDLNTIIKAARSQQKVDLSKLKKPAAKSKQRLSK